MDEKELFDQLFGQLVMSLHHAAFFQMGKIANPMTGKVERSLEEARATIDMLRMLREKTKNSGNEEEKEMLNRIVFDLEMNYVEESKKGTIIT